MRSGALHLLLTHLMPDAAQTRKSRPLHPAVAATALPALCMCSDAAKQRLTVRVLDADVGKADDLLGSTMRGLQVSGDLRGAGWLAD